MMTRQAFVTEMVAYLKRGEIFFVVYAWDGEYALHKLKELAQSHRLLFKRFTSSSYSLSELKFKVAGVAVPTLCVFWDGITGVSRPERLVDSVSDLLTRIRTQQLPWAVFVIVERRGDLPDRLSGEWPISVELRESELADVQAVLSRDNKAYQAWKALSPVQQQEVHQTLRGVRFTAAVSLLARVLREAPSPSEVLSTLRRERLNKGTSTRSVTMVPVNPAEVRVGGMQGFRQWLWETKQAFTAEGRAFGLPAPRGVLLVGLPGTGKSLAAKLVAAEYGLPLLRFDVPNVYGPYVGESEANMREALSFID
ncbi:MAG: AAA family ATPase, partial [Bacteroidetes bacterium]